ncbi:MAG TPA: hypothetical protein VER39_05710 [Nocardioidaceae bacterium]|nr:hypothetical protein [Nocardioidaceae bacterium]
MAVLNIDPARVTAPPRAVLRSSVSTGPEPAAGSAAREVPPELE